MNTKTLGQKRVGAEFNPSKKELVDIIKNKSAELIDLLEGMREHGSHAEKISGEKHRLISIAQTEIETACMYAVKSCFTK
ncbi:hypothetical protein LEQ04_13470 [Riemerella anatipestifer]|nr:hypothetical protein LEQ05_04200 [Riemerella anatipestifer]WPC12793.1 hypothetical protein LEQ03_11450 [Riemerella anatipestifer]WPC15370.1 hypothetical protein LEQ04_13470 [Riemerella anatipestifer]